MPFIEGPDPLRARSAARYDRLAANVLAAVCLAAYSLVQVWTVKRAEGPNQTC
jgi:hypothetical protein